jgi:hypothetical protein
LAVDIDRETLKIITRAIVWIVGIITFGRVAMFVATKYFDPRRSARSREKAAQDADALKSMDQKGQERQQRRDLPAGGSASNDQRLRETRRRQKQD